MSEETKTAPAEESKQTEPATSKADEKPETQKGLGSTKEETIGEVLSPEESSKEETKKEDKTVPLSAFVEMKKYNKELLREMKELKKSIEEGASKVEVSESVEEIAEKHGVDKTLMRDLVKTIREDLEHEVDEKVASKLEPITRKEKEQKLNEAFETHFAKALEQMPEYKDVVSKEVIKSLSLSPTSSKKTFTKLIEETYGHLVTGKRSLDSASTRAGKDDNLDVDMDKARTDSSYFKEVMKNPTLKKKYNDGLIRRISSSL